MPADLSFDEARLKDVAAWLSQKYRINVLLDEKSLADTKLFDARITRSAKAETLAEALMKVLEPDSLKWVSDNGVLYLAAAEGHEYAVHVYRTASADKAQEVRRRLMTEYKPESWSKEGERRAGYVFAYNHAVVVDHNSADHFIIRRRFADVMQRVDSDSSNLLPAKLRASVDADFIDAELPAIAKWVEKFTGFTVRIDEQSIRNHSLELNRKLTKRVNAISLAAALDSLLVDTQITWIYRNGSIVILALEDAEKSAMTVVYDMRGVPTTAADPKSWLQIDDVVTGFIPGEYLPEHNGVTVVQYAEPGYMVVALPFEAQRMIAPVMEELRWALQTK